MTLRLRGHFLLEVYYQWRQQPGLASLVDSGTLRFWQPLGPTSEDGVWVQEGVSLSPGTTWRVELDLLPREVFGRLIYLVFGRVRLLWLVNRGESQGVLQIGPAAEQGWLGPWSPGTRLILPPGNTLCCSSFGEGWPVTSEQLAIELTALEGTVSCDLLMVGDLHELPGSGSGDSSAGSSDSSEESGSSEWSSEDSSDSSFSSYDDSSWS